MWSRSIINRFLSLLASMLSIIKLFNLLSISVSIFSILSSILSNRSTSCEGEPALGPGFFLPLMLDKALPYLIGMRKKSYDSWFWRLKSFRLVGWKLLNFYIATLCTCVCVHVWFSLAMVFDLPLHQSIHSAKINCCDHCGKSGTLVPHVSQFDIRVMCLVGQF